MTNDNEHDIPPEWAEEDERDKELARWLDEIGFFQLARDVRQLRFANRIIETQRWIDAYEAKKAVEEEIHDKLLERIESYHARLFDKSATYNNVIVTLGYAGLFALWSNVKQFMHPWDMKLVALLISASLMIFIIWTLGIALMNARHGRMIASSIAKDIPDREEKLEEIGRTEALMNADVMQIERIWPMAFFPTVGFGCGAGLILMAQLLADIIGHPFSFHDMFFK